MGVRGGAVPPCTTKEESANLGDELLPQMLAGRFRRGGSGRLCHIVGRTEEQSVDGDPRPALGQIADHDDVDSREIGSDPAQGFHAVELRHVDVEGDEIRFHSFDLRQSDTAVGRRADDLEAVLVAQDFGDDAAGDHGIVHHENSNGKQIHLVRPSRVQPGCPE